MVKLENGPAPGNYPIRRAPLFLRAVIDGATGEKDVLDQLNDAPKEGEKVHVYRRIGAALPARVCRGRGGRVEFQLLADYRYMPEVDGEKLRETDAWRQWCLEHQGKPPTEKQLAMFPQYRPPH